MNNPNLASLQQQFRDALHYKAHQLPISYGVAEPDALLQVYRNNFIISLSECLACIYPVVFALVGDTCFNALARHHALNVPMMDPCTEQYGKNFNNTLLSIPNIIDLLPYISDLATLESHLYQINQEQKPLSLFPQKALSEISDNNLENVQLKTSPNIKIINSAYAIGSIWFSITNKQEENLYSINTMEAQTVLIQENKVTLLPPDEAEFIVACLDAPLGKIPPSLLPLISKVMEKGIFSDFTLFKHQDQSIRPQKYV